MFKKSCGLVQMFSGFIFTMKPNLFTECIKWNNMSDKFKEGFLRTWEDADRFVTEKMHLQTGISIFKILDEIGCLINENLISKEDNFEDLFERIKNGSN